MRILVEQHAYPYERVRNDLWEGVSADPDGTVTFDYVGYFYNELTNHCVMILPRVLLEDVDMPGGGKEERVFVEHRKALVNGKERDEIVSYGFSPEEIIDPDEKVGNRYRLSREQRVFIREFAVWIYRAVDRYWQELCKEEGRDPDDEERARRRRKIILRKFVPVMGRGSLRASHTLLDVILALIAFRKENETFFLSILRERQNGVSRVNWTRTVTRSRMIWTGTAPLYPNPVTRQREINLDEELFVIFYSILSHLKREYGFDPPPNPGFEELSRVAFAHYLNGYGSIRLRQIRGKYFSDRALKMWDLCFAFFEHQHQIRIQARKQEYLLAKDFQIVFEAMIDDLIGDQDIPAGLMEQADGKRVDHMYRYRGLSVADDDMQEKNKVYYIGDSKYYKRRTPVGANAVYKQFTYARNLVQWNLDLFLDDKVKEGVDSHKGERKLRNDATEGYAIVPNFFISARIDDDLRYDHPEITETAKDQKAFFSRQFENRLYDRDTLLVAHYNVNFLYVLALYARNSLPAKTAWKDAVRDEFRTRIRAMLMDRFEFLVITPKADTDADRFFREHFRDLVGRVYDPYGKRPNGFQYYSLALRKNDAKANLDFTAENEAICKLVATGFNLSSALTDLGTCPEDVVAGEARDPKLVMSSRNFEIAAKALAQGAYSVYLAPKSISAMKKANIFMCEKGVGIKSTPENMHTVFLFESGQNNILKAVLQVTYLDEVPSLESAYAYKGEGLNAAALKGVTTGGLDSHWLWRINQWVAV